VRILFEDVSVKSRHVTCGRERVVLGLLPLIVIRKQRLLLKVILSIDYSRSSTSCGFHRCIHALIVIHDTLPGQL
jgi:hypothetical protein